MAARIGTNEALGFKFVVGDVAAPTARNFDFGKGAWCPFDEQDSRLGACLRTGNGAKKSSRATADHD